MARSLTHKQAAFVNAYVGPANFVGSEAARMAGYTYKGTDQNKANYYAQMARSNLDNPRIQEEIKKRLQDAGMGQDETVMHLSLLARQPFNPADFIEEEYIETNNGVHTIARLNRKMVAKYAAFIKSIKYTRYGPEITFYDRQRSLEIMARYHGLLTDRVEHSGAIEGGGLVFLPPKAGDPRKEYQEASVKTITPDDQNGQHTNGTANGKS